MSEIYTLKIVLTTLLRDILPKQIKSPSGSENNSVSTKIPMDLTIPPANCCSIIENSIFFSSSCSKARNPRDQPQKAADPGVYTLLTILPAGIPFLTVRIFLPVHQMYRLPAVSEDLRLLYLSSSLPF